MHPAIRVRSVLCCTAHLGSTVKHLLSDRAITYNRISRGQSQSPGIPQILKMSAAEEPTTNISTSSTAARMLKPSAVDQLKKRVQVKVTIDVAAATTAA
mmetsp:Transcript_7757/g.14157  ORF Transcript_7757/g.14157 Transcript_7757/m.14157 type:complete len:99 (-) Transcript_7757:466-762(-)